MLMTKIAKTTSASAMPVLFHKFWDFGFFLFFMLSMFKGINDIRVTGGKVNATE